MRPFLAFGFCLTLAACAPQAVAPVPANLRGAGTGPASVDPSPVTGRLVGATLVEPAAGAGQWVALGDIGRPVEGWITDQETGRSARVELRPRPEGEIDLISLDALRALGIANARLVVIDVHYDLTSL